MTPIVVAGGVSDADLEVAQPEGDEGSANFRYAPREAPDQQKAYRIVVQPWRLRAFLEPTEHGWVATAPELGSLGYGPDFGLAVDDLLDAVEQYLKFLRDDQPRLASNIAHHARYIALLPEPRGTWLASVHFDASSVE